MAALELSPSVFSILSGLISDRVGLHYGVMDQDLLREKASARAMEAGFHSLLDYYYFLRYDEAGGLELDELVESLVVNETYLFREWPAVRTLVERFIAPHCLAGKKPRVWSAACATGEEPLSLAMLLQQKGLLNQVEIVASDISVNALTKARTGKYGKRSVRSVPEPELLQRFVVKNENGYSVSPELIDCIHWKRINLLSDTDVAALGVFDAILCRNVLIYFSDATVQGVLSRLSSALNPDGVLAVGVSESLLRYGGAFDGEEHDGAFLYRKSARK